MSDNLRDRIAAVLESHWPAPFHGSDRQYKQVADLADAVVEQVKLTPFDDFSYGPDDEGYHVDVTWVAPGEIAKMLGQND